MYKEIFRLEEMLLHENIPHEFTEHNDMFGYQIGYPTLPKNEKCVCSVIQHKYSYGNDVDLLEIWGLSKFGDDVEGYLSAEEVFERIKDHYLGGNHET